VLHVASRVVGEVSTEDSSPVAIPFVIDTLPPEVRVEGTRVEAWDYVSASSALLMRERTGDGDWSEWTAIRDVSPKTDAIEVKDEEGNIGKISLALRGRADPSIAATGSGCGCKTTESSSDLGSIALGAHASLLFIGTRTRRRSSNER
jgi:hypothetical protein